jgi:Rrf2 family protein
MSVSVKCEYALRAVLDLALHSDGQPVRIADIAARQSIPQKFLELILAELKRRGLLESRRGAEGGYLLGRPAELLTVGDVMRSIEGGSRSRLDTESSPLDELWKEINGVIAGVVDRTNFAELARRHRERQHRFVPNWEI